MGTPIMSRCPSCDQEIAASPPPPAPAELTDVECEAMVVRWYEAGSTDDHWGAMRAAFAARPDRFK
jgi:hypothetical protein